MAEQIRKYLIIPQIVIIMAVKIEQLEMCVEENTIADFKGIVGIVKQYRNEEQKRINAEIQGMSERYVTKLIPKARRIYLPKVKALRGCEIVIKKKNDNIIWKSKKDESLVNAVLHLITEKNRNDLFTGKKWNELFTAKQFKRYGELDCVYSRDGSER